MSLIVLIIVLLLLFGGGGGYYGYRRWGSGGGIGIVGLVLLILVLLYLFGGFASAQVRSLSAPGVLTTGDSRICAPASDRGLEKFGTPLGNPNLSSAKEKTYGAQPRQ